MASTAAHATPVAGPPGGDGAMRPRAAGAAVLLIGLVLVGAALRLDVARQSLFGDELSTFWIVTTHDLPGSLRFVAEQIEITPPLYFAAAWLAAQVDASPEALRAPSLLAGVAIIPLLYAVGARTVGRGAGLVAAALAALAPFAIYYSAEARGYQLMTLLVLLAAFAVLRATEGDGAVWWVFYGACACAAAYTHYTSVFGLGVLLAWTLVACPRGRRPALVATTAAAVAYLPWLPGFLDDLDMPDSRIMSDLSPLTPFTARIAVEHWSVGFPSAVSTTELRDLPGTAALALEALGLALGLAGATVSALRRGPGVALRALDRRAWLVAAMAVVAPAAIAAMTLLGTNLFVIRNLAVAWPWFALALAAVLLAAGPRLRYVAVGLVLAGFAAGAVKMTQDRFQRPDFAGVAVTIDREAARADSVLDGAVAFITPGPVTGLDATLRRPHRILRAGASQRRDGNFRFGDEVLAEPELIRRATAGGGRVFLVVPELDQGAWTTHWDAAFAAAPGGYRRVRSSRYEGFVPLGLHLYAPEGGR